MLVEQEAMTVWQVVKVFRWWKTKGDDMFKALLANPTLKGYTTKGGGLAMFFLGLIQWTFPIMGMEVPPELSTQVSGLNLALAGLVTFGLGRKVEELVKLLRSFGVNVPEVPAQKPPTGG